MATMGGGEGVQARDAVLDAHPFLDPALSERRPDILRYLYKQYLTMEASVEGYNQILNKLLHPAGDVRTLESNLATTSYYLNEAVHYIRGLLDLLPDDVHRDAFPRPEVTRCSDVLELLSMIFSTRDPVLAFEAQRKLYLTKLFFDIDHSWEVQRGSEHKEYVEGILNRELFAHVSATRRIDICYGLHPDGVSIDYSVGRLEPNQECWTFDLREIEIEREGRPLRLHVYYFSSRFKREVIAYEYRRGAERYELITGEPFPTLGKRRSASIASKMIRKGEFDPRWTRDLIGAMFIVENLTELEQLKELLFELFGGYFRVRNVVDTISGDGDRVHLNPQSGSGYKVYKAEIDILVNPERNPQPMPYFFTVEVQLYTLENYLRTIHSSHYANHRALKRRQFLEGLVPYIFPGAIYGPELVRRIVESAGPTERTNGHLPEVDL
jgi:hypothetical protein